MVKHELIDSTQKIGHTEQHWVEWQEHGMLKRWNLLFSQVLSLRSVYKMQQKRVGSLWRIPCTSEDDGK